MLLSRIPDRSTGLRYWPRFARTIHGTGYGTFPQANHPAGDFEFLVLGAQAFQLESQSDARIRCQAFGGQGIGMCVTRAGDTAKCLVDGALDQPAYGPAGR